MPVDLVYEERRTVLRPDGLPAFREQVAAGTWPGLHRPGGEVICVLGSLIGAPENEVLSITAYPDAGAWAAAQTGAPAASELVEGESARLMRPIAERPKAQMPDGDRKPFYGYRRWHIDPVHLDELVEHSQGGVWPRIEQQGARILGLWTTVASTAPLEVVLATGYDSPSHWEATRIHGGRPPGMSKELWEHGLRARDRRTALAHRTWVHLMRNVPFGRLDGTLAAPVGE